MPPHQTYIYTHYWCIYLESYLNCTVLGYCHLDIKCTYNFTKYRVYHCIPFVYIFSMPFSADADVILLCSFYCFIIVCGCLRQWMKGLVTSFSQSFSVGLKPFFLHLFAGCFSFCCPFFAMITLSNTRGSVSYIYFIVWQMFMEHN